MRSHFRKQGISLIMKDASILDLAKAYFASWNGHNIQELRNLFASNISLEDWDTHSINIENVLKSNGKIFDDHTNINAKILNLNFLNEIKVVAELKIFVDDETIIDVIDVITFDEQRKITNIKAYKC